MNLHAAEYDFRDSIDRHVYETDIANHAILHPQSHLLSDPVIVVTIC
jgi:hypothetical protein